MGRTRQETNNNVSAQEESYSEDLNLSQLSFSTFENSFSATISTPRKKKPVPAPKSPRRFPHFKVPRAPARLVQKKKRDASEVKFTCKDCGKGYVQLRYYKDHVRTHAIAELCHRFPDKETILENVKVIDNNVLQKCCSSPAFGVTGQKFKDLVLSIQDTPLSNEDRSDFSSEVCEYLVESISSQKFVLPSTLLNNVANAAENLLSNIERRNHFSEHIREISPQGTTEETIQHFICDYILKFVVEVISFISYSIRQVNNDLLRQRNIVLTEEDEEIVHFCSGGTIRGFINKGKRHPNNKMWQKIVVALKTKVLINENVHVQAASDRQQQWTDAQNRGKLLKVGSKGLDFFMNVYKSCILCERRDGCLLFNDVLMKVHDGGGAAYWDSLIEDALNEKESLMLMNGVIKSFVQTCGNGIARKRLNALTGQKAITNVALRHQVAPR